LKADGSGLVWSTYFGTAGMNRDFDIDKVTGEIFVASTYEPAAGQAPFNSAWFAGGFRSTPAGGADNVVAKISANGSSVVWATYIGGSGNESGKNSLRRDATGHLLLFTNTNSTNMPVPNGYQTTFKGVQDFYLARIKPDGTGLAFGTYLGGSDSDWCETHHLAVDGSNNVYVSGITHSPDFPTTAGAYQRTFGGINGQTNFHATGDGFVSKFSPAGQFLASSYLGGRYGDGAQGLGVDGQGNVYFTGGTVSDNLPVTSGAYQASFRGVEDFMAVKMSSDLTQVLYCTYLGSTVYDEGRTAWADSAGNFYIGGETSGTNWPVLNAAQGTYGGGNGDNIIVKFAPASTSPGALRFSASTYSVGEGGGQATMTVNRVNGSTGAVGVGYATSNGTAAAGSDYTAKTGTLSWAAGDTAAKTFTVPVTNDSAVEPNETINLTLSAPTGGATLGSPSTAVLTITDNDTTNVPPPPTGVAAMAGDGRITLVWNASTGATSYTVYSGTSAGVTKTSGVPHANATRPYV
ncbi:MAG: Calx-beta domain-containing protein, partial [Gammaproteobacteria bacterium]